LLPLVEGVTENILCSRLRFKSYISLVVLSDIQHTFICTVLRNMYCTIAGYSQVSTLKYL